MKNKTKRVVGWILFVLTISGLISVGSYGIGLPTMALMMGIIGIVLVGIFSLYLIF